MAGSALHKMTLSELVRVSRRMQLPQNNPFRGLYTFRQQPIDVFCVDERFTDGATFLIHCAEIITEQDTDTAIHCLRAVLSFGSAKPERLHTVVAKEGRFAINLRVLGYDGNNFTTKDGTPLPADVTQWQASLDRHRIHRRQGKTAAFTAMPGPAQPAHSTGKVLDALMAAIYAVASKAVSAPSAQTAGKRLKKWRDTRGGISDIPDDLMPSSAFIDALIALIIRDRYSRFLLVFVYITCLADHKDDWAETVATLGKFVEGAGIATFTQIRDYLIIPKVLGIALMVFTGDLETYRDAVEVAESLGPLAPFVGFLNLSEKRYFQTGKFPMLSQFLKGFLSITDPVAAARSMSASYSNTPLYLLGVKHGQRSNQHGGHVLQARGAEPSDSAGGRGESSSAARHPRPHRETEPREREPRQETRRPRHSRPHNR
ncbi:microtubule nucleation factor SSNA1 isoform X1 [Centroberyx affinis]|uniref:microtubule nucleation factor SSNA1 isoform X1 n=1 Tax=Centroberyx affinis TaxID=166261 RepID=UPI003A5C2755